MTDRPDEIIEHPPVTLRRYRPEDLDELLAVATDSRDHLRPFMPWAAEISRAAQAGFLAQADRDWDQGVAYNYAVRSGAELAGGVSLMARIGPGGLEIGYWIARDRTRQGLATAAAAALTEQAFRLPGVQRVEIVHDERNVASGGIPRKLGFTRVGHRPLDPRPEAGTGLGVVWQLTRAEYQVA